MNGTTAEEDDEEGFGDFTFAPPATVNSDPKSNGPDPSSDDDDDDDNGWSDFVNSSGNYLPRTESLPPAKSLDPFTCISDQQNRSSKSDKSVARTRWERPKGALPLSLFGEEEKDEENKEEGSGAAGLLFNAATELKVNKELKRENTVKSSFSMNDLISDLYSGGNDKGLKPDSKESGLNLGYLSSNGMKLDVNGLDLKRSVSNLGSNGLNWGLNGGDQWEFKVAKTKQPAGDFNIKGDLLVKAEHAPASYVNGSDPSWSVLGSDLNRLSSNLNGNLDANKSDLLVDESENFGDDDDDGWEFKVAESETQSWDSGSKVSSKEPDNSEGVKQAFEFGNGAGFPTDLFAASNGFSQKSSELDFGFDFSKSSVTPNGISSNSFSDSKQKHDFPTDLFAESNGTSKKSGELDFGFDFSKNAVTPNGSSFNSFSDSKPKDNDKNGISSNSLSDGKQKDDFPTDLFAASDGTFQKSVELDFGFDFSKGSVTPNGSCFNSFSESKQKDNDKNGLKSAMVNGNVDNGENSREVKNAFPETQAKDKENEFKMGIHKGALPLSFFGDEEHETGDSSIYQDALTYNSTSLTRGSTKSSPISNISINDLLSSLYSQAEQKSSINHMQTPSENNLASTQKVVESNIIGSNDDFDDDSWEFQDASSGDVDEKQTLTPSHGDSQMNSNKLEQEGFVDFYSNLKDELCIIAQCHLDNLKKARSIAALDGKDAKVKALDKEIQDLCDILHQESVISREPHSKNHPPGDICLGEFVEVLQDPKFQTLESEYHLSNRLSLAEKDWRSAIELLEHVTSISKILTLGSKEEQSTYVSTWSRMVSVCAQELRHGASIWEQSLQNNVHSQILLDPQGKQYILALGEIYRAVEVLGSSAKLYKPWVLSSYMDPTGLFALLSNCYNLWSSSGLEEALESISDLTGLKYNGTPKELLESVKHIHNLDALALQNHVFAGQGPTCQLSLLTAETVPGMKTVTWNGENYFLQLANLWANLVSNDPPKLPPIQIG